MPLWMWLFLLVSILYGGFVLWRAWAKKYIKYGPIIYSLKESPIYFWFFAFSFIVSELIFITFIAVAVGAAIWGPVFHS
jgi:hypothetical protein